MTDTKLDAICRQLELRLSAALLGYRNEADKPHDKRWPHFAWRVTVLRGPDGSYSTDYNTGIGHAKPMPEHLHSSVSC